jgi:hypothetical protein
MTVMEELDLGGIATGENFLLETDQPILVALNTTNVNAKITVGGALMMSGGSFTHLYVQNESATNVATVQVVVTD